MKLHEAVERYHGVLFKGTDPDTEEALLRHGMVDRKEIRVAGRNIPGGSRQVYFTASDKLKYMQRFVPHDFYPTF